MVKGEMLVMVASVKNVKKSEKSASDYLVSSSPRLFHVLWIPPNRLTYLRNLRFKTNKHWNILKSKLYGFSYWDAEIAWF